MKTMDNSLAAARSIDENYCLPEDRAQRDLNHECSVVAIRALHQIAIGDLTAENARQVASRALEKCFQQASLG